MQEPKLILRSLEKLATNDVTLVTDTHLFYVRNNTVYYVDLDGNTGEIMPSMGSTVTINQDILEQGGSVACSYGLQPVHTNSIQMLLSGLKLFFIEKEYLCYLDLKNYEKKYCKLIIPLANGGGYRRIDILINNAMLLLQIHGIADTYYRFDYIDQCMKNVTFRSCVDNWLVFTKPLPATPNNPTAHNMVVLITDMNFNLVLEDPIYSPIPNIVVRKFGKEYLVINKQCYLLKYKVRKECSICFENPKPVGLLIPCLHKEFCYKCVKDLKECPLCRQAIDKIVSI